MVSPSGLIETSKMRQGLLSRAWTKKKNKSEARAQEPGAVESQVSAQVVNQDHSVNVSSFSAAGNPLDSLVAVLLPVTSTNPATRSGAARTLKLGDRSAPPIDFCLTARLLLLPRFSLTVDLALGSLVSAPSTPFILPGGGKKKKSLVWFLLGQVSSTWSSPSLWI